jgi:preprotein translocase subunit SecE
VARQTRQQRRARRAEQAGAEPKPLARGARTGGDGTAAVAPTRPEAEAEPRRIPGGGTRRFLSESWAELRKVDWPSQPQVIQGTVVVLIACLVVGIFLWGADQVFERLVQKVLLR